MGVIDDAIAGHAELLSRLAAAEARVEELELALKVKEEELRQYLQDNSQFGAGA